MTANLKRFCALVIGILGLLTGCAHSPQARTPDTLAPGLTKTEVITLLQAHGGMDITSSMAVAGKKEAWPLSELYWSLPVYHVVISPRYDDDHRLTGLTYWSDADFADSLIRREQSKKQALRLTLNPADKTVAVPSGP